MQRATPKPCPHDLRPGTKICLHCRREALLETRARVRRQLFRVATALSALAAVAIAIALLGVRRSAAIPLSTAIRHAVPHAGGASPARIVAVVPSQDTSHAAAAASVVPAAKPGTTSARAATGTTTTTTTTALATTSVSSVSSAVVPITAKPPAAPAPAVTPVIPEGRDDLDGAIYAVRVGDTVFVHFDTPVTRTRRPEKFERTVRQTLPAVYGPVADSMLAAVPDGALTAGGDLLADLPTRGIRLTAPSGTALTLWPQTRPGEDGPLVVTYRVTATR